LSQVFPTRPCAARLFRFDHDFPEALMSFGGIRAVILIAVLIVLILGVTRLDLPGWILPVGLLLTAGVLKGVGKKASA
jgi:hypothetical protein